MRNVNEFENIYVYNKVNHENEINEKISWGIKLLFRSRVILLGYV